MKKAQGFTLIELMIAVSIIVILTAIAFPNFMNARKAGNETSAVGSLRALIAVNEEYRTRFGRYAPALATLEAAGYIDEVLGGAAKSGYLFNYSGGVYTWECNADPEVVGTTGDRFFYVGLDGVIRSHEGHVATSTDPPQGGNKNP